LVTVVIPAANEEHFIGACLDSVLLQDYPLLQVVVVDGGSTDGTVDVVLSRMSEDHRVELLRTERRNIPASLNLGLAAARGTWLVRIDAHCTVPPSYVRTAVRGLRAGRWSGVGGRKDGVGRTDAGKAIAVAMASRLGVGGSTYHHGSVRQEVEHLAFGAYPVELLRQYGGWDESLRANEDFELDYRLRLDGHRLLFDPEMSIAWHCRQSVPDLFRQYMRYGRGKADVVRLHPRSLSPRHVGPPAFVAYLMVAAAVALRRPRLALAMVTPYGGSVLVESIHLAPRLDTAAERIRVPAALAAMHLGWGLGIWARTGQRLGEARTRGRQSVDTVGAGRGEGVHDEFRSDSTVAAGR
jgi:cellulose synthase/poly-beta-1,6-N-acetylglucosamine synthase-like glycosyltransferase